MTSKESPAHAALARTLAERQLRSLRTIGENLHLLSKLAANRYAQAELQVENDPTAPDAGWIIGISQQTAEPLAVVITAPSVLYAGRLSMNHTTKTKTVTAEEEGIYIRGLLLVAEQAPYLPVVPLEAGTPEEAAIADVLTRPEGVVQNIAVTLDAELRNMTAFEQEVALAH